MFIRNIESSFDESDLYYCYLPRLKKFLCDIKKISYIGKGTNSETSKKYWLFIKTNPLLIEALTEWEEISKK